MLIYNSIILITSAGSVAGGALAERFCQLGGRTILVDHCDIELDNTYQRCLLISEDVQSVCIEDYRQQSIEKLFHFIDQQYQQSPDILINLWPHPTVPAITDEHPIESFSTSITSISTTLFSFVQLCAQRMRKEEKKGVVINIILDDQKGNDSGAKHASSIVAGFTQSWAKELTPFNIRVGGIVTEKKEKEPTNKLLNEMIRNTEYILENEYFSGRVMSA